MIYGNLILVLIAVICLCVGWNYMSETVFAIIPTLIGGGILGHIGAKCDIYEKQ